MVLRSALFACAAVMIAAAAAPAHADRAQTSPAVCEDMTFRVYFAHDSAALDSTTQRLLDIAERNMAGCAYAELHVRVDASSAYARQRGRAIEAAMTGRAWNAVRIEPLTAMHRASLSGGPDYAEVAMSSHPLPSTPLTTETDAGV